MFVGMRRVRAVLDPRQGEGRRRENDRAIVRRWVQVKLLYHRGGLGTIKRLLWERLEKQGSVTEIELAIAALCSDAGDDRAAAVLPVCLLKPSAR